MCLPNLVILNTVVDMENLETLKGFPKFDGKDPEQSRQEISVWLITRKGRGHLGLLKPPAAPLRNAGEEPRKEYEGALEKWEI